jgi:hypothetical protein
MAYRLPLIYKKLLILAVVFGPIVWLMFTADGQRRTDTVVLWLFGEEEIKMDLAKLEPGFNKQQLQQLYPNLDWQCQEKTTPYGDTLCVSRLGVFNGIPARYLTLFFKQDQTSALKLRYREEHHEALKNLLRLQLGSPELEPRAQTQSTSSDKPIEWRTAHGLVVVKDRLSTDDEAALFWLNASQLRNL